MSEHGKTAIILIWFGLQWIAAAAPYGPEGRRLTFTQPDGYELQLRVYGDEFYARTETEEGQTVVFDLASQAFYYAALSPDGSEFIPSGEPISAASAKRIRPNSTVELAPEVRLAKALENHREWDNAMGISERWAARTSAVHATERNGVDQAVSTGTVVGLTLCIDFPDAPAAVSQAEINSFCNQEGYSGYGNNGSVRDYFYDNSGGMLIYSNVVTPIIRVSQPKTYYDDSTKDEGVQASKLINDAISALKALPNYTSEILPTFDRLSTYTTGVVRACSVFYAGTVSSPWGQGLWPHSSSRPSLGLDNGTSVSFYQVSDMGTSLALKTFCHESGHLVLDYRDQYDYGFDSTGGAGVFCIMGTGGSGPNPVQLSAYLKYISGWAEVIDLSLGSNLQASLPVTGNGNNTFLRYPKPGEPTEYFLIENRQSSGRDDTLPGSGLAIWHVDEIGNHNNQGLTPNITHENYELALEQADGLFDFENGRNTGQSMDLWKLGNTASTYLNRFSDDTTPNANWWDGTPSGLNIYEISEIGDPMTLQIGSTRLAIEAVGISVIAEDAIPANTAVDPYERVTANITLKNVGQVDSIDLIATLVATNRIVRPSAPQSYGVMIAGGSAYSRPFSFIVTGTNCNESIHAVLQLHDGVRDIGAIPLVFRLGAPSSILMSSTNAASIDLNGGGTFPINDSFNGFEAAPYPSPITISGADGVISRVTATLHNLTHGYFSDLDVLLVGPGGQHVCLMSDVANTESASNVTITFDDAAASTISLNAAPISGSSVKPTDYSGSGVDNGRPEVFPAPAPSAPYTQSLAVFNGTNPIGTWRLYIVDDWEEDDTGTLAGGWSLNVTYDTYSCITVPPALLIVPEPLRIISESGLPPNHAIDPFERVTVELTLRNAGQRDATNVTARLQPSSAVLSPTAAQAYGTLIAEGDAVARPFTLTASGGCGETVDLVFHLQDAEHDYGMLTNTIQLGAQTAETRSFSNTTSIDLNGGSSFVVGGTVVGVAASPFASTIAVTNLQGAIENVTVTLHGYTHSYGEDIDVLLVSPEGEGVLLMSDVGRNHSPTNMTLTFDDDAAGSVPRVGAFSNGTYRTTDYSGTSADASGWDAFPAPAAQKPWGENLSFFNGKNPNGEWKLFVVDDWLEDDTGAIAGGWSLSITAPTDSCCPDSDGDYIPNDWEARHTGGSWTGVMAQADQDGDGLSGLDEYFLDFDPLGTSNEAFAIRGVSATPHQIEFGATTNSRLYGIEVATNLTTENPWKEYGEIIGANGTSSVSLTNVPGSSFYRIRVSAP